MAENQQVLPWGYAFQSPVLYAAPAVQVPNESFTGPPFVTWATLLSNFMDGDQQQGPELYLAGSNATHLQGERRYKISDVMQCPETEVASGSSLVHYAANPTAMPDIFRELRGINVTGNQTSDIIPKALFNNQNGNPNPIGQRPSGVPFPAKAGQLFPDNALFWDTPSFTNLPEWATTSFIPSYGLSFIDNDGGILDYYPSYGVSPVGQLSRYRDSVGVTPANGNDYFNLADGFSVFFLKPGNGIVTNPSGFDLANSEHVAIDPSNTSYRYYIYPTGNLRFRHQGESTCNTAFADGSVQGLKWNPNASHEAGDAWAQTEFKRAFYRIKFPGAGISIARGQF
ncbi:MAG: hypothetical protein AAF561_05875 [Planctomycetota bacterium]